MWPILYLLLQHWLVYRINGLMRLSYRERKRARERDRCTIFVLSCFVFYIIYCYGQFFWLLLLLVVLFFFTFKSIVLYIASKPAVAIALKSSFAFFSLPISSRLISNEIYILHRVLRLVFFSSFNPPLSYRAQFVSQDALGVCVCLCWFWYFFRFDRLNIYIVQLRVCVCVCGFFCRL